MDGEASIHKTLELATSFLCLHRHFKPSKDLLGGGVAVVDNDVVVGALLVGLQLKLGEQQLDPVTRRR